ncbi:MAG: hypothetical protein JKY65_18570 [Planctomycetes bacterium]|nr:hypothetical protein [Planctomycetota bacterium]
MTITARQRKAFTGISTQFGLESDESVRGLRMPVAGQATYLSLEGGRWRYWLLRADDRNPGQSFADAVGRLLPMHSRDCYRRLNALATGPIQPTFWERPDGESFIYDLDDPDLVERFALSCAIGEALNGAQRLLSISGKHGARTEAAFVCQDALPNLSLNVSLWGVAAPSQSLVFFPDGIFLRRTRYQWFVPYEEVDLRYEIARHTATRSTPSDVGISGGAVTFGELHLALSDQRVLLQVSNPELAAKATKALERLVELAPRPKVRAKKRVTPSGRQLAARPRARASVGQITIKSRPKESHADNKSDRPATGGAPRISIAPRATAAKRGGPAEASDEEIVIRVKLDLSQPPPPEPDDHGLETPAPLEDDLSLVFSDVSPMAGEPDPFRPPRADRAPARIAQAAPPTAVAVSDEVRSALGALLAYVAKSQDGFGPEEQRLIRTTLQLPRAFDLKRAYEAIEPGSSWLGNALSRLSVLPEAKRREALAACRAVAACGGTTANEETRLGEIASALSLA